MNIRIRPMPQSCWGGGWGVEGADTACLSKVHAITPSTSLWTQYRFKSINNINTNSLQTKKLWISYVHVYGKTHMT